MYIFIWNQYDASSSRYCCYIHIAVGPCLFFKKLQLLQIAMTNFALFSGINHSCTLIFLLAKVAATEKELTGRIDTFEWSMVMTIQQQH